MKVFKQRMSVQENVSCDNKGGTVNLGIEQKLVAPDAFPLGFPVFCTNFPQLHLECGFYFHPVNITACHKHSLQWRKHTAPEKQCSLLTRRAYKLVFPHQINLGELQLQTECF